MSRTYAEPPQVRPRRSPEDKVTPRQVRTVHGNQWDLHQVGWVGGSGALYAMSEKPAQFEGGWYGPVYFVAHTEAIGAVPVDQRYLVAEAQVLLEALEETCELRTLSEEEQMVQDAATLLVQLLTTQGSATPVVVRWPRAGDTPKIPNS